MGGRDASCKNYPFVVLFVAHLTLLVVLGDSGAVDESKAWLRMDEAWSLTWHLIIVAIVGSILGGIALRTYLLASEHDRQWLLFRSQLASSTLLGLHAMLLIMLSGHILPGLVLIYIVISDAYWAKRSRRRAEFLQALLGMTADLAKGSAPLLRVVAGCLILQALYLIVWAWQLSFVIRTGRSVTATGLQVIFLFLSLRWTTGVIKYTLARAVSGVFGAWAIRRALQHGVVSAGLRANLSTSATTALDRAIDAARTRVGARPVAAPATGPANGADSPIPKPVVTDVEIPDVVRTELGLDRTPVQFAIEAATTGLGASVAGSLLGLVSPPLWWLLRQIRRVDGCTSGRSAGGGSGDGGGGGRCGASCLHRPLLCIASVASSVLRLSHKYGVVHMAVMGEGWFEATRATWQSMVASGADGVVLDDCTDRLLLFACYIGGSIPLLFSGATMQVALARWLLVAVSIFWFGFAGVELPLTVIDGSVGAALGLFARQPESLSQCHPLVYHRFVRLSELRLFRRRRREQERGRGVRGQVLAHRETSSGEAPTTGAAVGATAGAAVGAAVLAPSGVELEMGVAGDGEAMGGVLGDGAPGLGDEEALWLVDDDEDDVAV